MHICTMENPRAVEGIMLQFNSIAMLMRQYVYVQLW